MNILLEDLEPYIEERIQSNYSKIKNNKEYCLKNKKIYKYYNYLYNKLNIYDKKVLEEICGLINETNSKANYFTYEIGFVDGIKLNDYIKKTKN